MLDEIDKSKPVVGNIILFCELTASSYLEQITSVITTPLINPKHTEFLIKLEELDQIALKIKFLFSGEVADLMSDFVIKFRTLLLEIYRYQIVLNKMKEYSNEPIEIAQKITNENEHREHLLKAVEFLKMSHKRCTDKNSLLVMEKKIKL